MFKYNGLPYVWQMFKKFLVLFLVIGSISIGLFVSDTNFFDSNLEQKIFSSIDCKEVNEHNYGIPYSIEVIKKCSEWNANQVN